MTAADLTSAEKYFNLVYKDDVALLQMGSADGANKLSVACQMALHHAVEELATAARAAA